MTIVTLSNGKKVANFSSPHDFIFEDESVLPKVSAEEAERLKVNFIEKELNNGDIELSFSLSDVVFAQMTKWIDMHRKGEVDVVFCPLPMISCIKETYGPQARLYPFRSIRIEDRVKKLVSIHKQCI